MTTVLVDSERLGEVEVEEAALVEFPAGIIGFPELTRYAVIAADDDGIYCWLQSVQQPSLAFLALVPAPFFPDYEPVISDEDCDQIGLEDAADAQLLCLVTASDGAVTANLLGPIVLNVRTRQARQVVLSDADLSTRAPVLPG